MLETLACLKTYRFNAELLPGSICIRPRHIICADYLHGAMHGVKKKKKMRAPPSANLPPVRPRLMTRSKSQVSISQSFHNYNALSVFSLFSYVFTRPGEVLSSTFQEYVRLRDFWNPPLPCNWPGVNSSNPLMCLQRPTFNLWPTSTDQGSGTKSLQENKDMHMFLKKPHCNKGRCAVKDKAKIILPAPALFITSCFHVSW